MAVSELGSNKKKYSKPAIGQKHGLFDGIIGYNDVKELFDMSIKDFASFNTVEKMLPPLLTRFRDIHFKQYSEQEFVEIAVEILDREEGGDVAMIIADAVYNRLKSTNIRECVRLARLTRSDNNLANLERIIETFTKYDSSIADEKA